MVRKIPVGHVVQIQDAVSEKLPRENAENAIARIDGEFQIAESLCARKKKIHKLAGRAFEYRHAALRFSCRERILLDALFYFGKPSFVTDGKRAARRNFKLLTDMWLAVLTAQTNVTKKEEFRTPL
jgi:hypothetical protein